MPALLQPSDPFEIKSFSRWNPKRLAPTLWGRFGDWVAHLGYQQYALPIHPQQNLPPLPLQPVWGNTALAEQDIRHLLLAISICVSENICGGLAEIGCYRGVTTRILAKFATSRSYYAVDPFAGYGGDEADYRVFLQNIGDLENVCHLRMTSGEAFRCWDQGTLALVFIDAVHNYANTSFDIDAWGSLLVPGGFLAAHDTDNPVFAGTRRAVFETAMQGEYEIFAHPPNLTILRKR